jgi:hypothetical protein
MEDYAWRKDDAANAAWVQGGRRSYKDIAASAARPLGGMDAAWKIMLGAKMPQLTLLGCKGEGVATKISQLALLGR